MKTARAKSRYFQPSKRSENGLQCIKIELDLNCRRQSQMSFDNKSFKTLFVKKNFPNVYCKQYYAHILFLDGKDLPKMYKFIDKLLYCWPKFSDSYTMIINDNKIAIRDRSQMKSSLFLPKLQKLQLRRRNISPFPICYCAAFMKLWEIG